MPLLFMAAMALSAGTAQAYTAQEIVAACSKLNDDYAYYRDRGEIEAYAALFTEDAEFVLGTTIKGREAIGEAARTRWQQAASRHFVRTVRITPTAPDRATGLVYLALFSAPRGATEGPLAFDGAAIVADYVDDYRMTDEGCLYERRAINLVFQRASG